MTSFAESVLKRPYTLQKVLEYISTSYSGLLSKDVKNEFLESLVLAADFKLQEIRINIEMPRSASSKIFPSRI